MATKTPNYNLTKPDLEDFADIRVLNGNLDIIDNIFARLNQGAIIASKLETNGFVKFGNGYTIQWGIGGNDDSAWSIVTYPIAFRQVFITCAVDAYWEGSDVPRYLSNVGNQSNNTQATFLGSDVHVGSYYWLAIGIA